MLCFVYMNLCSLLCERNFIEISFNCCGSALAGGNVLFKHRSCEGLLCLKSITQGVG